MNTALSPRQLDLSHISPALLIAHEHGRLGAIKGRLRREVETGLLLKLRRGLYARRAAWAELSPDERYQAFVVGVARSSAQRPVLSHASAAAIHGLPVVGSWPRSIHQIIEPTSGGRSDPGRVRHALACDAQDVEERDGRAESVNESNSRVTMARLGVPAPDLQHQWLIDGSHYDSDFYWRGVDGVGEADGKAKYTDERMRAGRTPAEVVVAEKNREDAIRGEVRGFTRWGYQTGMSTLLLGARLAKIGLHATHTPRLATASARNHRDARE